MSDRKSTKYDVAISLRWTDLDHARALYELLRDRLEVFFADERQEDIVGTDGEASFGHIFRDRARIVVVFYRPDWGSTPFTRAEEAAIKQRAWHEGYGFSVWVPMGESKSVPPYIPPQYIWFDFDRYGASGLASVIEARVRESGINVRPPSPIDELRRLRRERETVRRRQRFIGSPQAVAFFEQEVDGLEALASAQAQLLSSADSDLHFKVARHRTGRGVEIAAGGYQGEISYWSQSRNSSEGSFLTWTLWRRDHDKAPYPQLSKIDSAKYRVDLDEAGYPAWTTGNGGYVSTPTIVETAMAKLAVLVATDLTRR